MTNEKPLPHHASVVVVGGGIMGCSTLYHLAKEGLDDAILLERNQLTSGTTWHSAAQVRALRGTRNLTELIRYSISLYAQLEQETGQATGWINKGSLSKDFIGRAAPKEQLGRGIQSIVATILFDEQSAVPLGNEPVYVNGEAVGKTTSAAYGYRVGRPIAIAQVRLDAFAGDDSAAVEVDIARQFFAGTAMRGPAFDPAGSRMRG